MSTARVLPSLSIQSHEQSHESKVSAFELRFTKELRDKIAAMDTCVSEKLLTKDGLFTASQIYCRFKQASSLAAEVETSEEKAIIEKYNLQIMSCFLAHLRRYSSNSATQEAAAPATKKHGFARQIIFGVLTFFCMGADAINSLLFSQSLLAAFIPAFLNPLIWGLASIFMLLNAGLFYGFEARMLKIALKVPEINSATEVFIKTLDRQRITTQKINTMLCNPSIDIPAVDLFAYQNLATAFNQKILATKKTALKNESKGYALLRASITAFGTLMTIAGGYFWGIALLTTLAAGLIGTPAGWCVIAGLIATSLVLFAAMRASGALKMRSAAAEAKEKLDKKLDQFEFKTSKDFNKIATNKHKIEFADRALQEQENGTSRCDAPDLELRSVESTPRVIVNATTNTMIRRCSRA